MKKLILILFAALLLSSGLRAQSGYWVTYNTHNSEINGNMLLAIAVDSKNNKWVGTDLGLCKLAGRTWTDYAMFNEKLKNQSVNCLTIDRRGVLWIGTDDYGVIEFNGTHWTEYQKETKRLGMKFIGDIAIDQNDVKWIGVTLGGLVRVEGDNWTKYTADDSGLLSDFILCVTIDRVNRKWIGTNDGLCVFDDNRWIAYTTSNSKLPHNIVPAVKIDSKGVKWIGTLGGLCRFDGTTWTIYDMDNSPLPSNQINDLAFDSEGLLWIATDKGVAVFDCQRNWQVYTPSNSPLPSNMVQNVAVDAQGHKWFGTDVKGLVRFSGQGISGRVADEKGHPKAGVTVMCGNTAVETDADGRYYCEVAAGSTLTIRPQLEGYEVTPAQRDISAIKSFAFGQDFTVGSGLAASGSSTEKVFVNPYLEQGYITITIESAVAEVEFVNSKGESIRTIPQYRNEAKITISKMPKDNYTLYIRTVKGEKTLKFNLR